MSSVCRYLVINHQILLKGFRLDQSARPTDTPINWKTDMTYINCKQGASKVKFMYINPNHKFTSKDFTVCTTCSIAPSTLRPVVWVRKMFVQKRLKNNSKLKHWGWSQVFTVIPLTCSRHCVVRLMLNMRYISGLRCVNHKLCCQSPKFLVIYLRKLLSVSLLSENLLSFF